MARIDLGSSISCVLLAGGFGSRIRELFPDIPKPMIPVANLPIAEWIVRLWALQGIQHFTLSTGYLGEVIERHFAAAALGNVRIECVRELVPMGTAGALVFVSGKVCFNDAILVGNADSLCSIDIASCFAEFEDRRADMLICTCFREDASQFGRVHSDTDGCIMSFDEKVPGPGWVNAGVYMVRKPLISRFGSRIPLSLERDVFPHLLREGAFLISHSIAGQFLDIGTPSGYAAAEEFIQSHSEFESALSLRAE